MIHYSVYFSLRDPGPASLALIREFLHELQTTGDIANFSLLQNSDTPPKSALLPYQAWIAFADEAQFSAAFSAQAARGIHTGLHGRVVALVKEFRVEVFRALPALDSSAP